MGNTLVRRFHAELSFAQLKDKDRHDLVAGFKTAATTSPLILGNPALQTCVTELVVKDGDLTQRSAVVTTDRAKLSTDLAAEATSRGDLDGEIRTYVGFVEKYATKLADIQGAALPVRLPNEQARLPPDAPVSVDTKYPKTGHGKVTVSVHEIGKTRRQYAAEWSPNPVAPGSWAQLGVGHGKSRLLTGASGTQVWVRFATVRGTMQSDWCAPILVTIP